MRFSKKFLWGAIGVFMVAVLCIPFIVVFTRTAGAATNPGMVTIETSFDDVWCPDTWEHIANFYEVPSMFNARVFSHCGVLGETLTITRPALTGGTVTFFMNHPDFKFSGAFIGGIFVPAFVHGYEYGYGSPEMFPVQHNPWIGEFAVGLLHYGGRINQTMQVSIFNSRDSHVTINPVIVPYRRTTNLSPTERTVTFNVGGVDRAPVVKEMGWHSIQDITPPDVLSNPNFRGWALSPNATVPIVLNAPSGGIMLLRDARLYAVFLS